MPTDPPRRWFITGISTGLGNALMRAVIARGDQVTGTSRNTAVAAELTALAPDRAHVLRMDLSDPAQVAAVVDAAVARMSGIDVVVNSAGFGIFGPIEVCDETDFQRVLEVNFYGLVRVTKAALPHLRASKGTLVNISSMAGLTAQAGCAPYAASKYAVQGFTEALAAELAPLGVSAFAVAPGGFRTNFWSAGAVEFRHGLPEIYGDQPAGRIPVQIQSHLGHEMGDPARFAAALIEAVGAPVKPTTFVAGADAMFVVREKLAQIAADVALTKPVAVATSF